MQPPKKPAIVVRSTQEGTNTLLEQWCESLSDRVIALEEGQKDLGDRMGGLEGSSAKNTVLLEQVLLAVRGQQVPGLEVPGLTDRLHQIQEAGKDRDKRLDALEARTQLLEEFKFRTLVLIGVATSGLGLVAYKSAPYIVQILGIIK